MENCKLRIDKKGEIATTLTLLGMGVIVLGTIVGSWLVTSGPLSYLGRAQSTGITLSDIEIQGFNPVHKGFSVKGKVANNIDQEANVKVSLVADPRSEYLKRQQGVQTFIQFPPHTTKDFATGLSIDPNRYEDWLLAGCPAITAQIGWSFFNTTFNPVDNLTLEPNECPEPTNPPPPTDEPDLKVESITFNPDPPVVSQRSSITVAVKNIGAAEAAASSWVKLYIDEDNDSNPVESWHTGLYPSQQTRFFNRTHIFYEEKIYSVRAKVFPDPGLGDSDDSNNEKEIPLDLRSAPQPGTGTISGNVQLIGSLPSGDTLELTRVDLYEPDSSTWVQYQDIDLDANQQGTYNFQNIPTGDYELGIAVIAKHADNTVYNLRNSSISFEDCPYSPRENRCPIEIVTGDNSGPTIIVNLPVAPEPVNCDQYTSSWNISSVQPSYTAGNVGFSIRGSFEKIEQCGRRTRSLVYVSGPGEEKSYYYENSNQVESVSETEIRLKPVFSYEDGNWNFEVAYCRGNQARGNCTSESGFVRSNTTITNPVVSPVNKIAPSHGVSIPYAPYTFSWQGGWRNSGFYRISIYCVSDIGGIVALCGYYQADIPMPPEEAIITHEVDLPNYKLEPDNTEPFFRPGRYYGWGIASCETGNEDNCNPSILDTERWDFLIETLPGTGTISGTVTFNNQMERTYSVPYLLVQLWSKGTNDTNWVDAAHVRSSQTEANYNYNFEFNGLEIDKMYGLSAQSYFTNVENTIGTSVISSCTGNIEAWTNNRQVCIIPNLQQGGEGANFAVTIPPRGVTTNCSGITYSLTPTPVPPNNVVDVRISRADASSCLGNWDNIGLLFDGSSLHLQPDGQQGYQALIGGRQVTEGIHTLQFTVNNGTCWCNPFAFEVQETLPHQSPAAADPDLVAPLGVVDQADWKWAVGHFGETSTQGGTINSFTLSQVFSALHQN